MEQNMENRPETKRVNSAAEVKDPQAVLRDPRLTQEEKNKILQSLEQDQVALLRAEGENMIPQTNVPSPADLLTKIKKAEQTLEKTPTDAHSGS